MSNTDSGGTVGTNVGGGNNSIRVEPIEGTTGGSGGSGFGGAIFIDPATLGSDGGTSGNNGNNSTGKRKPGRPRGPGKGGNKKTPLQLDGVATVLKSIHGIAAAVFSTNEWKIDDEESASLAKGIINVSALYDVQISEKAAAWASLVTAVGEIYGPRVFAIKLRRDTERAERRKAQQERNRTGLSPDGVIIPGNFNKGFQQ